MNQPIAPAVHFACLVVAGLGLAGLYLLWLPLSGIVKGLVLLLWCLLLWPLLARLLSWSPSSLLALEQQGADWFIRVRDGRLFSLLRIQPWGLWLILSSTSGHWLVSRQSVTPDCWAALCRQARGYPSA